ncbi:MAG: protein-export rane protein SecD, partial [Solirubrobacterales bacterium]|nr:protein-export rane protein SecD [Solirubrobacterales bacterium]
MSDRRRNGFILLLVLGLILASGVAIASKKTILGLDLKGGVELVYQGKPSAQQRTVTGEAIQRTIDVMRKRVDQIGVASAEIQRQGADQISIGLPDVHNLQQAERQVGTPAQLAFYDWEGAGIPCPSHSSAAALLVNQPGNQAANTFSEGAGNASTGLSLYQAAKCAATQKAGPGAHLRLTPEYFLFYKKTHNPVPNGIFLTSKSDFASLKPSQQPPNTELVTVPVGITVLQAQDQSGKANVPQTNFAARFFVLRDNVAVFGRDITNPQQGFDSNQVGSPPDVEFKFTGKGKTEFHSVTRAISQRGKLVKAFQGLTDDQALQHFAVALDRQLISVATIDYRNLPDGIDGTNGAIITGNFTISSAQDLANLIKLGALPIGLKLISSSQVSATLGKQALHQGLIAGAAGLALVMLFLLLYYRVLGLIATGALIVYGVYFFALIKLVPITLTLPGIAGLILTIGVAADANIVIFERVKEEVRAGRSIGAAIAAGYKKGLSAIIDANVVTIMTAFILFILATSDVKGFAFTLGIGTIVSLFTAVLATQAILGTMGRSKLIHTRSALGVREKQRSWHFDFMGASKYFFSMSGVILLVGALAIGGRGLHFGIDFESGTRITTALSKPASEAQVRAVMSSVGVADAKIQKLSNKRLGNTAFQISSKTLQPPQVTKIQNALNARFGVPSTKFQSQSVGPTFGKTVANAAVVAIIASLLVISAYIALRFEWKYAVPVLIALMHDLLITSGVYSLTGRQVTTSTVAALLTILGYSLYDTIIVFDRVRENVPRMPRAAFSQIVNRSMSEVLTRSMATTFCTLLPVVALLFFGGSTLKDFAFALMIGVASGAYSSIFIASPVLTHWKERESVYKARHERLATESPDGLVPAYAPVGADAEPVRKAKASRGRITAPDDQEISRSEFEALKETLDVDEPKKVPRA